MIVRLEKSIVTIHHEGHEEFNIRAQEGLIPMKKLIFTQLKLIEFHLRALRELRGE